MIYNTILDALKQNDGRVAWTKIYEVYRFKILHYITRKVTDRMLAEELMDDVFIKNFQNRTEINSISQLEGCLLTTANHLIIDHYRSQGAQKKIRPEELAPFEEKLAYEDTVRYFIEEAEYINEIVQELDKQPDKRKEVCEYLLDGHSISQVAEKMNVTENTVYAHRRYIKMALIEKFGSEIAKYILFWFIGILLSIVYH